MNEDKKYAIITYLIKREKKQSREVISIKTDAKSPL